MISNLQILDNGAKNSLSLAITKLWAAPVAPLPDVSASTSLDAPKGSVTISETPGEFKLANGNYNLVALSLCRVFLPNGAQRYQQQNLYTNWRNHHCGKNSGLVSKEGLSKTSVCPHIAGG